MTTGETIALTRRTFVGKVLSLLLNMLSGLVIAFHIIGCNKSGVNAAPPPYLSLRLLTVLTLLLMVM